MRRLCVMLVLTGCAAEAADDPWPLDEQSGLRISALPPVPELPDWADNPATEAKAELGLLLFNDLRLSGSGQTSCSTCHFSPSKFQSNTPLDLPDRSAPGLEPTLPRNTPSLLNLVYAPVFRWDGSLGTDLYEQMVLPLAEANMDIADRLAPEHVHDLDVDGAKEALHLRLTEELPGYLPYFEDAFGVDLRDEDPESVWRLTGMAMAVTMRSVVSRDSDFDAWNAGEGELDEAALRGLELFLGEGRCIGCHNGPLLSDFGFHDVSTSVPGPDGARPDEGRFLVTGDEADRGRFLTPTLRSASRTSPYFHDGSETRIVEVIARHFEADDPNHDPLLVDAEPLTEEQREDLVEFIKSLDGAPLPAEVTEVNLQFP